MLNGNGIVQVSISIGNLNHLRAREVEHVARLDRSFGAFRYFDSGNGHGIGVVRFRERHRYGFAGTVYHSGILV